MSDFSERLTAALADRYAIEREIGSGGMAIVYLARDIKHNRQVAIKVLRPELAAALGAERFLREIETSAGLNHPHILTLIDSGQHDDFLYYVMPYVEGESLRRRLDREPRLPVDESLLIAREVADALGYAHRQGVVHRDIKPENILLSEGHAVIMDFGIAEAIAEAGGDRLTATGLVVGSPAYMSPEQASGERSLDARSDIYSLGCVLYEMLAGDTPHSGDTAREVLAKRLTEEPQPIAERRSGLPEGLPGVVHRALAKEPAGRFESAEALKSELTSVATALAATDSASSSAVIIPGSGRVAEDRPSRSSLIVGAVLITAIIAIIFLMLRDSNGREPGDDEASTDPAVPAVAVLPFDIRGEGLDVWREGMVDVLSTNLSGAAGLRPISSRTVMARWRETAGDREVADLETSLAVARNADADYALIGHVIGAGSSLRFSVDIHDLASGKVVETVQIEGPPDSVFGLVDGLSLEVLRTLVSDPDIDEPRVHLAGTTTSSLDALKYFLAGDSHFRRSNFRAAIDEYEDAIAADSLFALAHLRLSVAYGWLEGVVSGRAQEEQDIAGRLADRLPSREQLLVKVRFDFRVGALDYLEALRELTRTHPDDAEAWYLLGEMYVHAGENIPVSWAEIEEPFRRAVELEPDFAPYREHLVHVATFRYGDSVSLAGAIEGLERARGSPARSERLALALAFGDSSTRTAAVAELDTVPASTVVDLVVTFGHPRFWPHSRTVLATAYQRGDALSLSGMPPEAFRRLIQGFMVRSAFGAGRIREGLEYLDLPEATPDQRACEAYTASSTGLPVPESTLARSMAGTPEVPGPALLCTGAYAADMGRWDDHATAVEALDRAAADVLATGDSTTWRLLVANARVLEAYGTLQRGDPAAALPMLERYYTDASPALGRARLPRWWLARAYLEAGRPADAVPFFRSFWISPVGVALYRLGQTLEELNEDGQALAAYEEFVAAWEGADPEVQYMVDDARARIGALRR